MLQTQRQGTINLGTARAGLVLAAAIAAAAVVGQLIATNPVSLPSVGGASSVSTWQSDASTRREGSSRAVPAAVTPADVQVRVNSTGSMSESSLYERLAGAAETGAQSNTTGSMSESSLYERLAGAAEAGAQSTQTSNGGGAHRGHFIPQ